MYNALVLQKMGSDPAPTVQELVKGIDISQALFPGNGSIQLSMFVNPFFYLSWSSAGPCFLSVIDSPFPHSLLVHCSTSRGIRYGIRITLIFHPVRVGF